ncbi:hypothetical protein [Demequina gelatinilytica]|uniref:hypothetical protein n=1 Tax=Demequina gelatinilytica TaxID=1638980 RepID=UPI000781247D|nr:hypothetical protein [Demequina gelatinilytica]
MTSDAVRVGWVESPLQLINAVEAAAESGERTLVLLRRGVAQLSDTAAWLSPLLPASVTLEEAAAATDPRFARSRRRLVGDAFSGQVRAVLAAGAVGDLVVVDDGSAALHLAAVLAGSHAFSRMGQREPMRQRMLGRVVGSRLRAAARAGQVTLMTAYADHPAMPAVPGARIVANRYPWLRSLSAEAPVSLPRVVVLGSALAVDGYIDPEAYERWVVAHGAGAAYLPHRREPQDWLARVSAAGLDVVQPGLPAEIVLGTAPDVAEVRSLPSSTGATLAQVLPDGVRMSVTAVPDHWWTDRADAPFRSTLTYLAHADHEPTEES